jgi:tripartite-type tricarboxylate transporter receptor subunit TctC
MRIALVLLVFASSLLGVSASKAQATFPQPGKPLRVIVPYAPGGSTDLLGRIYAEGLRREFPGTPVIVENRAGAGTVVAYEELARGDSDGHAVVVGGSYTTAALPHLRKTLPFDLSRDFVVVGELAESPLALIARAEFPAQDVSQLIEMVRAKPESVTYGSSGAGAMFHLATELLSARTGIKMIHVPYRGSAPTLADLVGGSLDIAFDTPFTVASMVSAGKVKVLGITGEKRSVQWPRVKTFSEQGVSDFRVVSRFILLAQRGTPNATQERLHAATRKIVNEPVVVAAIRKLDISPSTCETLKTCEARLQSDRQLVAEMIRLAGIRAE